MPARTNMCMSHILHQILLRALLETRGTTWIDVSSSYILEGITVLHVQVRMSKASLVKLVFLVVMH